MAKEHFEFQDITTEEWNEIKELYVSAEYRLNGLKDVDSIEDVCDHVGGYELMIDTFSEADYEDIYTISIATDHREPNTLQGIRVRLDKTTHELSRYIDIFFNDEEYPFEEIEIKTED